MKYIKHYQCTECGNIYPKEKPMNLCPNDQRPVKMVLDTEAVKADYPNGEWFRPDVPNMWRFGPLMPFDIGKSPEKVATLGEGHTPVVPLSFFADRLPANVSLFLKDEGQPHKGFGANPTGSFKDRGMSMVTTMAKHYGLNRLVVPTQGNAGDSLSEYARANNIDCAVIMPDDTPMPIMGKVAAYAMQSEATQLKLVKGTIREAGALMKEAFLPEGWFNCATFQEPGWRIEGKKTMGLELAEPWPEYKPDWSLPDVVLYPTGGGTGILGMWKAFDELEAIGAIGIKRPRIIVVQSEENAPVVDALQQGLEDTIPTQGGQTLATGLNVPGGVGHKAVLEVVRASNGGGIKVPEGDIEVDTRLVFKETGVFISPEGAAATAALSKAVSAGLIKENDTVVCFNTGGADKYWPDVAHLFYHAE